jgi:hypothetical protein
MYHYVSHVFGWFHPSNTGDFPVTHSSPSRGKAWYPEQWRAQFGATIFRSSQLGL